MGSELEAVLLTFTPGMVLFVPDELLALWFPPGPSNGGLAAALEREISRVASQSSCTFDYVAEKKAGRFMKLARC